MTEKFSDFTTQTFDSDSALVGVKSLSSFPSNAKYTLAGLKTSFGISGTNTGDQNVFSTIAVSGQSNVVADSTTDTLTLVAGSNVTLTTDASTDSITIASSVAASDSFKTIAVSGQSDVVADSPTDTLTLVAGANITLTTNAATDTITIAAAGGGGGSGITIGSTSITGGTNGNILYNNAGAVGELTPANLVAGALKSATTNVSVSSATAPTNGQVLTATSNTTATWQTPSGGSGLGSLTASHSVFTTPVDATTYYFGCLPSLAMSTSRLSQFTIPTAITLDYWSLTIRVTGTPSNENVSYYVRVNDTTDYTITTTIDLTTAVTDEVYSYGTFSSPISLNAGDKITIKMVTPTWATNPTQYTSSVTLFY